MTETVEQQSRRFSLPRRNATESNSQAAKPPLKKRIRPLMLIAGIALIIVCGLVAAGLVQSAGKYQKVLTISKPVLRGQIINGDSLGSIDIAAGQNTKAYTDDQAKELVGKIAIVDLPAGSIVTPGAVATELLPADGSSIVSLSLKPEQTPARPFVAGDPVRLIDTGGTTGSASNNSRGADVPGVVVTVKVDPVSNNTVLDISVKSGQASEVAARIARNAITIVVDANTGGDRK